MFEALKMLFPPDTPPLLRWRLAMVGFALMVIFHICWACGAFNDWGVIGFARADDAEKKVATVKQDVKIAIAAVAQETSQLKREFKDVKVDLLEQRIFDAQRLRCKAQKEGSDESVRFYTNQVTKMHREYFSMTHTPFPVPNCAEVGES